MKKIVKMSLVAAVAVAGLTTANAKPLEEAIKNVDVSGTVVYRYNDYNENNLNADQTNNYKIGLNLSSKVNDDVKLNTRFIVGSTANDFVILDTNGNDTQANVGLSQVYFGYTGIKNTTVNVGKQGLTTPWTVAEDSDGNEQTGTGILALSTVGPVTLAGAYFNQTNLNESGELASTLNLLANAGSGTTSATNAGGAAVATVGVIANVGPVALNAWYLDMESIFDTYTVGAKTGFDVAGVKLGAEASYTSLDRDDVTTDNNAIKLILTAKAGIVDGKYVYVKTDKEGGITAVDRDAATSFITWNIWTNNKTDADLHHLSVGVQALDTVHVSANYTTLDYNSSAVIGAATDDSQEELYAQVVYNMSKNLSTYVRFGTYEEETNNVRTVEQDYRGRLQVQYSF